MHDSKTNGAGGIRQGEKNFIRGYRRSLLIVMAGHSRPKDGVASARLCPAIHVLLVQKTWMPGTRPGMTNFGGNNPFRFANLLPRLHATRLAVAHQPVEMHPDVGGFR